ncbi:restriction endonuclease subunit S [Acinetobacter sp. YH12208]|uniref:restriction endonuclease subunit S n=1 Tax=Acinetobacter sp. YH12208 TaxID=2601144 RepID=UPI0015D2CFA0|nr:restriction endonuclease subunit S [Acinetobacter sp. YH12208]
MFPKLRFKEFDGDWQKTTIGAKSEIVTSGSRDWAQYYSDSGDKFIRMTNLVRNGINLDLSDLRFVQLPVGSNEGKRTSLEKGDILISITAELGKLGWIPEGLGTAYINQHTALVRMKNTLDSKFVAYALSTEKYNNKLNSLNDSGAKAGLNLGSIRSFELTIPSKPEQTQIASFLSAVDEKISQLTKKHELLSQYKQGMMQKLFSQQIRFKADDGSEFGEWESKTLGDVADIVGGGTPSTNNEEYWNGNVAWLTPSEINKKFIGRSKRTISEFGVQKSSAKKLPIGTVLFTSRATIGEVAISTAQVTTNQGFQSFIVNSKILNEFLYYWIVKNKQQFIERASGSTFLEISKSKIQPMKILLPCIEEQTKIASFLSAIDQKIEVVAQQIEQAKQWKKGLLQNMFI